MTTTAAPRCWPIRRFGSGAIHYTATPPTHIGHFVTDYLTWAETPLLTLCGAKLRGDCVKMERYDDRTVCRHCSRFSGGWDVQK